MVVNVILRHQTDILFPVCCALQLPSTRSDIEPLKSKKALSRQTTASGGP